MTCKSCHDSFAVGNQNFLDDPCPHDELTELRSVLEAAGIRKGEDEWTMPCVVCKGKGVPGLRVGNRAPDAVCPGFCHSGRIPLPGSKDGEGV